VIRLWPGVKASTSLPKRKQYHRKNANMNIFHLTTLQNEIIINAKALASK